MDIQANCRSKLKREVLVELAQAYALLLKLDKNPKSVTIVTRRDVQSSFEADGFATEHDGQYFIFLQSTLKQDKMARILAHEMVHIKQFVLGQLKIKPHNKRYGYFWLGKLTKNKYLDRPWEIEAYSKESLLMHKAFELIRRKYGNSKTTKTKRK
jgi:hypothetical protein